MKKRRDDKTRSESEVEAVLALDPPASEMAEISNASSDSGGPDVVASEDEITNRVNLAADANDGAAEEAPPVPPIDGSHIESILESLLFAADRPLTLSDLKRLLGERDGKRVTEALEALRARHDESGIQLVSVAGGWQLRTHPANGAWVAKLVAGRPPRLSRAMMETLSIVAYRQPITRPRDRRDPRSRLWARVAHAARSKFHSRHREEGRSWSTDFVRDDA